MNVATQILQDEYEAPCKILILQDMDYWTLLSDLKEVVALAAGGSVGKGEYIILPPRLFIYFYFLKHGQLVVPTLDPNDLKVPHPKQ